jgi:hypothetical protein
VRRSITMPMEVLAAAFDVEPNILAYYDLRPFAPLQTLHCSASISLKRGES